MAQQCCSTGRHAHHSQERRAFDRDRLVIDDQNVGPSGGGFGNTVQSDDGTLISCYSYRGHDNNTHIEAVRWQLPTRQ